METSWYLKKKHFHILQGSSIFLRRKSFSLSSGNIFSCRHRKSFLLSSEFFCHQKYLFQEKQKQTNILWLWATPPLFVKYASPISNTRPTVVVGDFIPPKNCETSNSGGMIFCELCFKYICIKNIYSVKSVCPISHSHPTVAKRNPFPDSGRLNPFLLYFAKSFLSQKTVRL